MEARGTEELLRQKKNASNEGVLVFSDSLNCATYCDQTAAHTPTNRNSEETFLLPLMPGNWSLSTQLRTAADGFISRLIVKPIVFTVCVSVCTEKRTEPKGCRAPFALLLKSLCRRPSLEWEKIKMQMENFQMICDVNVKPCFMLCASTLFFLLLFFSVLHHLVTNFHGCFQFPPQPPQKRSFFFFSSGYRKGIFSQLSLGVTRL